MLIEKNNQILVDTYAMEVYLDKELATAAYRGLTYYEVIGSRVVFHAGFATMRFFNNEKELSDPDSIKCYPLGFPMRITSEPSVKEIRNVVIAKGCSPRESIVMTYYRGDPLIVNCDAIKDAGCMMMALSRLEQGKMDNMNPEVACEVISSCQSLNNMNLRVPMEEIEIFVGERYQYADSKGNMVKYRFHEGKDDMASITSMNTRTDVMKSTTFQGIMHEDINRALMAAVVRKHEGIVDEVVPIEAIMRGLDVSEFIESDSDA